MSHPLWVTLYLLSSLNLPSSPNYPPCVFNVHIYCFIICIQIGKKAIYTQLLLVSYLPNLFILKLEGGDAAGGGGGGGREGERKGDEGVGFGT